VESNQPTNLPTYTPTHVPTYSRTHPPNCLPTHLPPSYLTDVAPRSTLEGGTVRIDKEDIDPICPHCQMLLQRLIQVKRGFFAVNRVFCCPHCRKVLGISAGAQ